MYETGGYEGGLIQFNLDGLWGLDWVLLGGIFYFIIRNR